MHLGNALGDVENIPKINPNGCYKYSDYIVCVVKPNVRIKNNPEIDQTNNL